MTDREIPAGYADCTHCGGAGRFRIFLSGSPEGGSDVACGNCAERRTWEGLEREPQSAWCVWTKTGRRPSFWHASREGAEAEARRLARLFPGKTFIVFEKLVNIRSANDTNSSQIRASDINDSLEDPG